MAMEKEGWASQGAPGRASSHDEGLWGEKIGFIFPKDLEERSGDVWWERADCCMESGSLETEV